MKRILLADDEEHLRMLVHATLEGPDVEIFEAADGGEALGIAMRERPDLLVLDWMMPVMSGIEVARRVKKDPTLASVPVIMLTARSQEENIAEGQAAGTFAYLVKPFSPLELLETVQRALRTEA